MNSLFNKLERLNGKELRDLLIRLEEVRNGKIVVAGPVSKDYEKYQLKNHPDTVDIAVTVVMGAPFPDNFCRSLRSAIEALRYVFEPYNVRLHIYKDYHLHATVSPIVRTTFDPDIYLKDPVTSNQMQRQEVQDSTLNPQQIKKEVCYTQPFSVEVCSWDIKIGGRGEILLWGSAKDDKGKGELEELRKRLGQIAGSHARDKGFEVHIALATIQDFHSLTGLQKKEIAGKINDEFESIPVPDDVLIDRVRLVQYLHRSLSRVDSSEEIRFC